MTEYGTIIGQTSPSFFDFNIGNREIRPVNYEYVQIDVEEPMGDERRRVKVLGQVKRLISTHPFYDQRTSPSAARKQRELGADEDLMQVIATAKILGYIHDSGGRSELRRPRSPPMPGTPVFRASDELLREFFSLGEKDVPLRVGCLLHREGVEVPISGKELHRHTAILAMTRYGKSYFAGRIMEELLRQGASILTIDAHGDYANMVQDPDGRLHEFFHDKVTVYRPESSERFEGPHVEPLRVGVSSISSSELFALARVEGDLQRIILRRAVRSVSREKPLYAIDDVIEELETEMPEKGEERKRIANVIMRLEDIRDQGIFSDGDLDIRGFFEEMHMSDVFLSGMADHVQDALVGMILRRVFEAKFRRQPWARQPLFIFIEEAHRFASPPEMGGSGFSRDIIARIAAEGAKFGLFLTVVSQRPRRIDQDILSNCSNLAILRIVNRQDQLTIQAASESFSEDLVDDLPALEQGEAVLIGPFVSVPVMIRTAARETKHGGRTPDIYRLLREAREEAENERQKRGFKLH
jgi:hypothetical protein